MTIEEGNTIGFSDNYTFRESGLGPLQTGTSTLLNTYQMYSENHHGWSKGENDRGGPFLLIKETHHVNAASAKRVVGNTLWFDGQLYPGSIPQLSYGSDPTKVGDGSLDAYGTTAIARTAPTNPSFDLSQAIGELKKDGLPDPVFLQSLKDRTSVAKKAGGEYLNVEFGWKPLLSDVRGFARTVKDSNKIIRSHARQSGHHHTRVRHAQPSDDDTKSVSVSGGILSPTDANVSASWSDGSVTTLHRLWFSGAFKYYVPVGDDMLGKMALWESNANHLFGTRITPHTLWELAPWSWGVDWFTNTGDLLNNISLLAEDSLVLQYGYVMAHTQKVLRLYMRKDARPTQGWASGFSCSRVRTFDIKQRRPATPYGFGIDIGDLTDRQWAIITALGLSRGGRHS